MLFVEILIEKLMVGSRRSCPQFTQLGTAGTPFFLWNDTGPDNTLIKLSISRKKGYPGLKAAPIDGLEHSGGPDITTRDNDLAGCQLLKRAFRSERHAFIHT